MTNNLAAVFKMLRRREGLSQEMFAAKLGISRNTVNGLERGIRPITLPTIVSLSRVTGLPAWKIVRKAEGMPQQLNIRDKYL